MLFDDKRRRAWTGVRWQEYERALLERLPVLHRKIHTGSFRAQPSRRVYISKTNGRQRPLGIASIEDKIVQQAVTTVLSTIYEENVFGFCVLQKYAGMEVAMT